MSFHLINTHQNILVYYGVLNCHLNELIFHLKAKILLAFQDQLAFLELKGSGVSQGLQETIFLDPKVIGAHLVREVWDSFIYG